jgi:hypothetical protein
MSQEVEGQSNMDAGSGDTRQRTTLTRSWVIKSSIFAIVLGALGVWGLVDATIVYPSRGRAHASFMEFMYLGMANEAGMLSLTSVSDPKAALVDLNQRRRELEERLRAAGEGSLTAKRTQMELLKREWLLSLSRVGLLTPDRTMLSTPVQRIQDLGAEWSNKNPPKPLAAYDIPMQWVFVLVGFGGCAWFVSLMLRVKKRVFHYDSFEHKLTLPDGRTITPDQISEVDKRKWDKFFVTLRLQDGSSVKLDLLRHTPLEQWVLDIEKHTPGYEAEAQAATPAPREDAPEELEETVLDVRGGWGAETKPNAGEPDEKP